MRKARYRSAMARMQVAVALVLLSSVPTMRADADADAGARIDRAEHSGDQRTPTERALEEAERSFAAGDLDRARTLLGGIRRAQLREAAERSRFDALRRSLRRASTGSPRTRSESSMGAPHRAPSDRQQGSEGTKHSFAGAMYCLGFFGVLSLLAKFFGPFFRARSWRCDVCGIVSSSRAAKNVWTIDGKRCVMCSNCNRRAANRKSAAAWS